MAPPPEACFEGFVRGLLGSSGCVGCTMNSIIALTRRSSRRLLIADPDGGFSMTWRVSAKT